MISGNTSPTESVLPVFLARAGNRDHVEHPLPSSRRDLIRNVVQRDLS
ncbi:hypothetical protein ACIHFD_07640 [Nonomuraea sp. NPDC051941]